MDSGHGIVAKLQAAGVVGDRKRSKAEIDADISAAKELIRRLQRERKSIVSAENMARNRRSPVWVAKWKASVRAMWDDPEKSAAVREAQRQAALQRGKLLPPMTPKQRSYYNKIRPIMGRAKALGEVFREVTHAP